MNINVVSIINEGGGGRLPLLQTNRKYLFIFKTSSSGHQKGFYLKLRGKLHFLKDNLYLYGYIYKN